MTAAIEQQVQGLMDERDGAWPGTCLMGCGAVVTWLLLCLAGWVAEFGGKHWLGHLHVWHCRKTAHWCLALMAALRMMAEQRAERKKLLMPQPPHFSGSLQRAPAEQPRKFSVSKPGAVTVISL